MMTSCLSRFNAWFLIALSLWLGGIPAPAADLKEVNLGIAGTSSDVIFALANSRGYFKEEGLLVRVQTFKSAVQMMAPIGTNQLDVIGAQLGPAIYNAAVRGIRLRVVASKGSQQPGFGSTALLVRRQLVDSGAYRSPADLRGRKVAVLSLSPTLNAIVNSAGLSYNEVDPVELAYPQHQAAFINGAIDASVTAEPAVSQIVASGAAVRIAGSDVFYPNQQTSVVVYSQEFVEKRTADAVSFMRAYARAARVHAGALSDGKIKGPDATRFYRKSPKSPERQTWPPCAT